MGWRGYGLARNGIAAMGTNTSGLMPPWKKGQSGNARGSSQVARFRKTLKKTLLSKNPATDKDPQLNRLIQSAYSRAMAGQIDMLGFLRFIAEMLDGKEPLAVNEPGSGVLLVARREQTQTETLTMRGEQIDTDNRSEPCQGSTRNRPKQPGDQA